MDYLSYLPWATPHQAKVLKAMDELGNQRKAADRVGCHKKGIYKALRSVQRKAASQGHLPTLGMSKPIPEPLRAKGVSALYNADGTLRSFWLLARTDQQAFVEMIKEEINEALENIPPIVDLPAAPLDYDSDIIPWIQIGDAHLGMLAYDKEVGDNFDVDICVRDLTAAFSIFIDELPACERLVINDLGDFTHYENAKAKTEASGHDLDADGRFPRMIKAYRRLMIWMVKKALSKARHVDVIINQGNHSRTNDWWMAELLRAVFESEKRVHILDNESVFIPYRMGNTLVMVHHSDQCKPEKLADVMTTDFKRDYGETTFHYVDIGHIHHRMVAKEHPGIMVESWNQLAGSDKYAHDHGWRSRRCLSMVLRSKKYGEVGRRVLPIEEVREKMNLPPVPEKEVYRV